MDKIKKEIDYLISKIKYYDYMYFVENTSLISDLEYDLLKQKLEELENQYPQYIRSDSPTYTIGFNPTFDFPVEKHEIPMLSLRNTYSINDVIKFIEKDKFFPVILEPKIDGVSLSLIYFKGILQKALLRGDGNKGENIFEHIMYTSIPIEIDTNDEEVEIRGEIFITHENFQKINNIKLEKKENPFQNIRNGTSGIIRNKQAIFNQYLTFIPYTLYIDKNFKFGTQSETIDYLNKLFSTKHFYSIANNSAELEEKINHMMEKKYSFESDGIVIKTNNLIVSKELGYTDHHPRSAIAYKFTNQVKETTIKEIVWQVSRNGKLTPIGKVHPIELDGAMIKKIALHNKKYIINNKINIGNTILIERVGSTVPQIKKVISNDEFSKIFIKTCPSCDGDVSEDETNYLCTNNECKEKIQEELIFFCKTLQLKGLGDEGIKKITEKCKDQFDFVKTIMYDYNIKISGWNKFQINSINILKNIDPITLLCSLGFDNLGNKSIRIICDFFKINNINDLKLFCNLDNINNFLKKESIEEEIKITNIGKEKLLVFFNTLNNKNNLIKNIIEIVQNNKTS